jgi:ribosomal-protein-alanine N-acetyltransferase
MELVGYICFWAVFEELRVMNLTVGPSWRRRGIGRELVHRALAWGHEHGARRALLEVRASNSRAIHLYEQAGFRVVGKRERYYMNPIEDAILMGLERIDMSALRGPDSGAGGHVFTQEVRDAVRKSDH